MNNLSNFATNLSSTVNSKILSYGLINSTNASFVNVSVTSLIINGTPYSSNGTVGPNVSFTNASVISLYTGSVQPFATSDTVNLYSTATGTINIGSNANLNVNGTINGVYLSTNINASYILTLNNLSKTVSPYGITAVGIYSGTSITTGDRNTLLGSQCGRNITTGSCNTAMGTDTLFSLTGSANTAIGQSAMSSTGATSGFNTGIGYYSQNSNQGNYNTALGAYSDQTITNSGSNYNVAIGYGTFTSNVAGIVTLSSAIGANSNTGGYSRSTALGYNSTCTANNQIMIGTSAENVNIPSNGTIVLGSNTATVNIGTSGTGATLNVYGPISGSTITSTSDYRLKENVNYNVSMDISLLKPCYYNFINTSDHKFGFIAHEVQEVIPQAVVGTKDGVDHDSIVPQRIDYSVITAASVHAIQKLMKTIEGLEERIRVLENESLDKRYK